MVAPRETLFVAAASAGQYIGPTFHSEAGLSGRLGSYSRFFEASETVQVAALQARLKPQGVYCRLPPVKTDASRGGHKRPIVRGALVSMASMRHDAVLSVANAFSLNTLDDEGFPAWSEMLRRPGVLYAGKTPSTISARSMVEGMEIKQDVRQAKETLDLIGLVEGRRGQVASKFGRDRHRIPIRSEPSIQALLAVDLDPAAFERDTRHHYDVSVERLPNFSDRQRSPLVLRATIPPQILPVEESVHAIMGLADHIAAHLWLYAGLRATTDRIVSGLRSRDRADAFERAKSGAVDWLVAIEPAWDYLGFDGPADELFDALDNRLRLQNRWTEAIQRLERALKLA